MEELELLLLESPEEAVADQLLVAKTRVSDLGMHAIQWKQRQVTEISALLARSRPQTPYGPPLWTPNGAPPCVEPPRPLHPSKGTALSNLLRGHEEELGRLSYSVARLRMQEINELETGLVYGAAGSILLVQAKRDFAALCVPGVRWKVAERARGHGETLELAELALLGVEVKGVELEYLQRLQALHTGSLKVLLLSLTKVTRITLITLTPYPPNDPNHPNHPDVSTDPTDPTEPNRNKRWVDPTDPTYPNRNKRWVD
jgi:hypothetical protein